MNQFTYFVNIFPFRIMKWCLAMQKENLLTSAKLWHTLHGMNRTEYIEQGRKRRAKILRMLAQGMSQAEVGRKLGVSRMAIHAAVKREQKAPAQ